MKNKYRTRSWQAFLFLLIVNYPLLAQTVPVTTAVPNSNPPPNTVNAPTSASAQVNLSPSATQLGQAKALFHHARYKYLRNKKNEDAHLSINQEGVNQNGA